MPTFPTFLWIVFHITFQMGFLGLVKKTALGQNSIEPYWPKMKPFNLPVGVVKAPGLPQQVFVVEQRGKVYQVEDKAGASRKKLFLNLSKLVTQSANETGLLGLAFHPQFQKNGLFYVSYSKGEGKELVSCISKGKVTNPSNPELVKAKLQVLISVAQPYTNHNGGAICFGPDGYLYFSWGDGGAGGDPQNNAQNINSLLGKVHRINVDKSADDKPYAIPADNPFAGKKEGRPEIYAWGLRNVWQMHFDPITKKLWAGDVGQNRVEEIDLIERGKNYGWRIKEGNDAYEDKAETPSQELSPPVFEYHQTDGNQSVTGGLVYRGKEFPALKGKYVYGDYVSGRIWAFDPKSKENRFIVKAGSISCFGENSMGEILFASHQEGIIYLLK